MIQVVQLKCETQYLSEPRYYFYSLTRTPLINNILSLSNIWSHIRFCSDPELFTARRTAQRLLFDYLEKGLGLSSLLFINLTAAASHRSDLHCGVFTFYNVNRWLELGGKCTLSHELKCYKETTGIRRERTGVSGECWVIVHCCSISLRLMLDKKNCMIWLGHKCSKVRQLFT